jgi:hypothetical protein
VNPAVYTVGAAIAANAPSSSGGAVVSYSVSPALPPGLSLNTSTGVISGTPTTVTQASAYVVTASNSAGSATAGLAITINAAVIPPGGLAYSVNPAIYTVGTAISPNTPSSSGGAVTSYFVSPALPAGLSLNTSTGIISGTPSTVTSATSYTVTATNSAGSATAGLSITVNAAVVAPSGLTYSVNPAVYTAGSAISPSTPSSSGGAVVSYSVSPALPAGLSLNTATGVISGTPSVIAAAATYTVTATNSAGSTTVGLTITVKAAVVPPSGLTYSENPAAYTVGTPIAPNAPSISGGAVVSYSVSPPLPLGLSLNTSTGVISGTPTAEAPIATYTVSAQNTAGNTTVGLMISVSATTDVLFVIDDSGSMSSEQASLARNFGAFVNALAQMQKDRAATGLQPFEFHIAITTSSIFEGWLPTSGNPTCSGQPLQCAISSSYYTYQSTSTACSDAGAACDDLVEHYFPMFVGCSVGVSTPNAPYPQGSFVAVAGNPSVLHFSRDVWAGTPAANASLATLSTQFQQNINVGTCGSGMEQHFEAGLLAVQKALAGQQPNVTAGEWPHAGAKMVVVWLGDEDDCSNPNDPTKALAFDPKNPSSSTPGSDVCIADQEASTHKMFPLDRYVSYFTGLGRAFRAAFIYSADPTSCVTDGNGNRVCTPGTCSCQCPATCSSCGPTASGECNIPSECSGKIPALPVPGGSRFAELSTLFRAKGVNTFEASVCDANWGSTLQGIARLMAP